MVRPVIILYSPFSPRRICYREAKVRNKKSERFLLFRCELSLGNYIAAILFSLRIVRPNSPGGNWTYDCGGASRRNVFLAGYSIDSSIPRYFSSPNETFFLLEKLLVFKPYRVTDHVGGGVGLVKI